MAGLFFEILRKMTKFVMTKRVICMKAFHILIKEAREKAGLKVRDVAVALGIDASLMSRIEAGKRMPSRAQVRSLAQILHYNEKELLVSWLSSRIIAELGDDPLLHDALVVAEERTRYNSPVPEDFRNKKIKKILKEIDEYKSALSELRKLDSYRISQALELEYTFHSNKIEGNTLTLQETELVINHGLTISGKSVREHLEVINHTDAITFLHEAVKERKPITEKLILQLHALVLRGIDRENAGTYRRVQVRIGGSSHIPPDSWQVPFKMEELMMWYNENKHLHPVLLAAEMHERLVSIHPFIDGNGRTSRLLMNLILLQHGYVIATIKGDQKERLHYYDCLENARTDDKEMFLTFIAETELRCISEYISILRGGQA